MWVPNCPFLHVAFIIRSNMNSSDAEYFFSSSFAVSECTLLHIREHANDYCFVLLFMCLTSEASWLEQNQLSTVLDQQTGFDIHSSDAWRGKPLSLPARTNCSLKQQRRGRKVKTHNSLFSHQIPLHTVQPFQDGRDFQDTATVGNKGSNTTTTEPLAFFDTKRS